uniref:Si:ch1073-82l19.1 n=1 Tax=Schistocephalus solidus TaxID=70667 RepID=A0A183TJL8_SCHSO
LEDTCVRWIAKNLTLVTSRNSCGADSKCFWMFPNSSYRISARPAQKILQKLCKYGIIKDEYMTLFSSRYVDLISPVLKEAPVTPTALRVLREFELYNLTATNLKEMNLNSLIGCLGEDTAENLVSLNVSGLSIVENKIPVVVSLGRLRKLQILNVSKTKFTNECLQTAVNCLPNLRFLNISRTSIDCINALLPLHRSLTGLIMHRLHLKTTKGMLESILSVILQLHELRVLDVSSESQKSEVHVSGVEILCSGQALPHLTHIDLCGNLFGLTLADVANLIQNHPQLEFAGLAAWPQRHRHELEGIYQLSLKYPHITMLADRGQKPLLAILLRNKDRRQYLQTAFHNIFEETSSREWLDPELLAAVLRVMRLHMSHSDMILAGTAVVYNLTRGEQSAQLPLDLLNRAVNITLTAIEQHQKLLQLLKNCFLTLCSDTVLHRAVSVQRIVFCCNSSPCSNRPSVYHWKGKIGDLKKTDNAPTVSPLFSFHLWSFQQFSCKRCCELVFQSLIKYDDVHMKRMGVAIISILAAEVSMVF